MYVHFCNEWVINWDIYALSIHGCSSSPFSQSAGLSIQHDFGGFMHSCYSIESILCSFVWHCYCLVWPDRPNLQKVGFGHMRLYNRHSFIFAEIIFTHCRETAKSTEFIALKIFALYSTIVTQCSELWPCKE